MDEKNKYVPTCSNSALVKIIKKKYINLAVKQVFAKRFSVDFFVELRNDVIGFVLTFITYVVIYSTKTLDRK